MDIRDLKDEELIAQAREWRCRALRGEKDARGIAHELEREVRHRFGMPKSDTARSGLGVRRLAELPGDSRRRWTLW